VAVRKQLESLQVLRFVAAAAVMMLHAPALYERAGGQLDFKPYVSFGFAGVDVFFVISGFIMWITTTGKSGPADALTFAFRRATRIYLTFWIVFAFILWYSTQYAPSRLTNADFVRSFFLLPQSPKTNILDVTWSLTYELYFYALMAVAIALGGRRMMLVTGGIALVAMIALRAGFLSLPGWGFIGNAMVLEFFAGCVLAIGYERGILRRPSLWFAAGTAILIVAMTYASLYLEHSLGWGHYRDIRVAFLLPMAVCFVAGAVAVEGQWRPPRLLVNLGDSSYGIYLWHAPLFVVCYDFVKGREISQLAHISSLAATIVFVCVWCLLLAKYVENPILKVIRRGQETLTLRALAVR
jgi:peptidoglycan/LPS O-acetylase OafA/YrhL